MGRMLLVNLAFVYLPLALAALGIVLVIRARAGGPRRRPKHYFGLSLLSLPAGVAAYIVASSVAASVRGDGHFYSIPFGGYQSSDNAGVGISALLWVCLTFVVLASVFRPAE